MRGVFLLLLALTACTSLGPPPTVTPLPTLTATPPTPDPLGTAVTFLDLWEQGDYAGMYSLISPLSQAAVPEADFVERYTSVAAAATITGVETRLLSSLKTGASATALYEVTVHTALVGSLTRKIEMPLVYTGGHWAVSWTDGLILPELAGGNTVYIEQTVPARANIYDRGGRGLAVQGEAVAIGVQPNQITDEAKMLDLLAEVLDQKPEAIQAKYANARPDWYVPIGEASAEAVQSRLAQLSGLSGVYLSRYTTRFYPYGGVAPHVVGYTGSITPDELEAYRALGYTGDERVGVAGLEAWAEAYLAGKRGGTLYAVSPAGQIVAPLAESRPQPAQAVYTTLDRDLQRAATESLGDFKGAVVVMAPDTGEVLAMVSNPGFDPNLFDPTNRNSSGLSDVLNDPGRPLLNRATQGAYPPGSVFKVPMMAAALMSGLYERDTTYTDTGSWSVLGPAAMKYCWTVQYGTRPHGKINLLEALAYSCDTYFYTIAYDLYNHNANYMTEVARQFGLGQFTGIEQVAEAQGLIPSPAWKLETYGEQWTPGDSVNMGIGQGYVLATPLQIAQMMAAVRNGGTLYQPQLVHHIAPPGGQPTFELKPIVTGRLPVDEEQLAVLQEALRGVTTYERGTARHRFLNTELPVAGKTGTSEDPAQGNPHAWFAGYTEGNDPDKPDLVIVVVVENVGEGSDYAAPIFRRILEIYTLGRPYTLLPWESEFGEPTPAP